MKINEKKKLKTKKNKTSQEYYIFYETYSIEKTETIKIKYNFDLLDEIKNRQNLKFYAVFKKNSEPFYETTEFLEGGSYDFVFQLSKFKKIDFKKFINQSMKLISKFDFIKGIRFRTNKKLIKIQFWSTNKLNESIIDILKRIPSSLNIPFVKTPEFNLFFPEPLSDANYLSLVELRGKKVNILRFGLTIAHTFFKKKWWEIEFLPIFQKYYIPHTNVIDIGANIGSHSLLLSEIISNDSLIFSFEPVYWDIIQRNILDNGLEDKICLFTQGLGKQNEVIEINVMDRMIPSNFGELSIVKKIKSATIKKKIGVITLDSVGLKNISLIKLDVEGMEREVLEGAKNTITENLPTIIIEIWPEEMSNFINSDIGKYLLNDCQYELIHMTESISHHDYILVSKKQNYMQHM